MTPAADPAWIAKQMHLGNEAFRRGAWREAVEAYERARDAGAGSADLFFNLGQAHHQLGALGEAAWAWERALALRPGDVEARGLLEAVRTGVGAQDPAPALASLFDRVDPDLAAAGMLLAWGIACASAVAWGRRVGRSWVVGCVAAGALLVAAWGAASTWVAADRLGAHRAVVIQEVEAVVAPHVGADVLFSLPPTARIEILRIEGPWMQVERVGRRGWVPADRVRSIRDAAR